MPSFSRAEPGSCCDDAYYESGGVNNEGDRLEAYGYCQNCGATWRDVFTYSHSEVQD